MKLKEIDSSKLDKEILEYGPIECMNCEFNGPIPRKFFIVEPDVTNEAQYHELRSLVKEALGYDTFTESYCDYGFLISVCRCPKCNSEEIFEDF